LILLTIEGIIFGEDPKAARWIFSISAASTMYLGLAVLVIFSNYLRVVFSKRHAFAIFKNGKSHLI
jgi:hypothetical protein